MDFKLFRLDCFIVDRGARVPTTVYLNPAFIVSVERDRSITMVKTTTETYYTEHHPDTILEGLSDITKMNNSLITLN